MRRKVHNHAPNEGKGLLCPEFRREDGKLVGQCMLKYPNGSFDINRLTPYQKATLFNGDLGMSEEKWNYIQRMNIRCRVDSKLQNVIDAANTAKEDIRELLKDYAKYR